MILTRAQALKASGRTFATVRIPEFDEGELRLASPTAGSAIAFSDLNDRLAKGEAVTREIMVLLIETSIVDADGAQLFDKASAAQFLDQLSPDSFKLISDAVPKPMVAVSPGNSSASQTGA